MRNAPSSSATKPGFGSDPQGLSNRSYKLILFLRGLFAAVPLVMFSAPYLLSVYAMVVIGHWPQPMFDDPKFIPAGPLYHLLYGATFLLFLPMLVSSLVIFPMLTAVMWRSTAPRTRWLLLALFIAGWVLVRTMLGDRMAWLID